LGIEVTDAGSASEYSFGSFRLLPDQQLLLESDKSVRLSSRAREILVALLERPGVLVSKEELFARVYFGSPVYRGGKLIGHTMSETMITFLDGKIDSMCGGQKSVSFGYRRVMVE
jgi:DNA-binding response OmpR family regulator